MNVLIYGMVYLGAALMVYNVFSYARYTKQVLKNENWQKDRLLIRIPVVLLTLFLLGYLAIGIFGKPDLIVAGILLGGSIFVFVIYLFLQHTTSQIQENEHLIARLSAAEESGRFKSNFLSSMSHEMRTPLNLIIGLDTVALRNPGLDATQKQQLEQIGASARHMLRLIDDILDMSHLETGMMEVSHVPLKLKETLDPVNEMVREKCREKGLAYFSRFIGQKDIICMGDAIKIRRMLMCVLENAVKFTPVPGTVSFEAEQTVISAERCHFRFLVKDTGIGIDEEYLPRLYDAFSQEDASTTSQFGGSGLGLGITRHLVDLMDGQIEVQSRKGKGTSFTITMDADICREEKKTENMEQSRDTAPFSDDGLTLMDHEGFIPGNTRSEAEDEDWSVLHGRRVLIAEDIDLNAEILADILELEEISSERAENGQIAVRMFEQREEGYYDAILMDIRMPVMDGLDATRTIRKLDRPDARTIPILAVTANALRSDVQSALQAGMNAHMAKPLDSDELYHNLKQYIRSDPEDKKGEVKNTEGIT